MIEFKDKDAQREYDELKAHEDELLGELEEIQRRISLYEKSYERE
jgi:hypothetical protein